VSNGVIAISALR